MTKQRWKYSDEKERIHHDTIQVDSSNEIATLNFLVPFHIQLGARTSTYVRSFSLSHNSPNGCSSLNGLLMVIDDNAGRLSTNVNEGRRWIYF